MSPPPPWSQTVTLAEIARSAPVIKLSADGTTRVAIARELGLERLDSLTATVKARPWLDGAELDGELEARVTQICSATGDPFEQVLTNSFQVRVVPEGSDAAPRNDSLEVDIDPEGEDPPDVLESDKVDVGAYVVEHLALEIEPFPRKPGAVYQPPTEETVDSPFAVLQQFRKDRAED
ncbi:MAG: DUF177 domain-containing protein [Caulobacter sp.]|nr:DUF177 domain-containing protein [Caulobacter sp.]